jgi:ubiquinol-cytochrome c reductase subunit 9
MSTIGGKIYNIFFKKSSTYFITLIAGAFVFEAVADQGCDYVFDTINKGKQWKDIKNNYAPKVEAAAEEAE